MFENLKWKENPSTPSMRKVDNEEKIWTTRLGLQCQNPLIPYPLSPSTVPFTKFRWGLWFLWLSQAKVKSTPSPRPKTGVWQYWKGPLYEQS